VTDLKAKVIWQPAAALIELIKEERP